MATFLYEFLGLAVSPIDPSPEHRQLLYQQGLYGWQPATDMKSGFTVRSANCHFEQMNTQTADIRRKLFDSAGIRLKGIYRCVRECLKKCSRMRTKVRANFYNYASVIAY